MLFDDPAKLDPDEILDWYALCAAGLVQELQEAHRRISQQASLQPYLTTALPIGSTMSDVDDHFRSCREELELATVLTMVATTEGRIRIDASRRSNRSGDDLARRLARLFDEARVAWQVPLYENGIMEAWKTYIRMFAGLPAKDEERFIKSIGALGTMLNLRHWVAHGRYWQPKLTIESYPPTMVARIVDDLYISLRAVAQHGGLTAFP